MVTISVSKCKGHSDPPICLSLESAITLLNVRLGLLRVCLRREHSLACIIVRPIGNDLSVGIYTLMFMIFFFINSGLWT